MLSQYKLLQINNPKNNTSALVRMCVRVYLVNFMPAVLVLAADDSMVVQQELAAARVSSHDHAVIQRSQTTAVLVVW